MYNNGANFAKKRDVNHSLSKLIGYQCNYVHPELTNGIKDKFIFLSDQ
jgi:hypothetical protein